MSSKVKRNILNQPKGMPWWHWVAVDYGRNERGTISRHLRIRQGHPYYWWLALRFPVYIVIDRADRALRKYTGAGWLND